MIKKILIVFFLGGGILLAGRFLYWNKRIMDLCDSSSGMKISDISRDILNSELKLTIVPGEKMMIIHSTGNFGRGVCILEIKDGIIDSAIYDVN